MSASNLPNRNDVPTELTWDLSLIFKSTADFEVAYQELQAEIPNLKNLQATLISSAADLLKGLEQVLTASRKLESIYVYASMKSDQDTTNNENLALVARATSLYTELAAATSFLEPEILKITDERLAQFMTEFPALSLYQHYFDKIRRQKAHILPANEEELLAGAQEIFETGHNTFNVLTNSDLEYPFVEDENGEMVRLNNGLYSILLESTDRDLREGAFMAMYQTYGQFINTLAQTLSGEIKRHNFSARTHHYESAKTMALSANNISDSVYQTLVETVNQNLPLLHRYVALRKKVLGVKHLHTWDLYAPMTGEPKLSFTYAEAKEVAKKALAPLGADYLKHVDEIFNNRYIDVVENKGKRSGAYSGGGYDTPPYELLNWQDNINNLFTLVHETGHSMHSWYTRHNQPYVYGDYPIFVAEIASTTNEALLTEYLLKTETDPEVRAYILNYYLDGFKGTMFRQTQFAEFEDFIHQQDAAGIPLTADMLSQYYGELNKRYYGPDLTVDPQISYEWARIPHFYYDYYVYQYATGFAAANTLSQKIVNNEPGAVEAYLTYLKSGSSADPLEIMQKAGIDMTTPDYLNSAFANFEAKLSELEQLIAK